MTRLLALLALVSSAASAQGFDLERLELNLGARQTLLAQTGDGLEAQALRLTLLGQFQYRPLVLTVDGKPVGAVISARWTTLVGAAFALTDLVELGAAIPIVVSQQGDDLQPCGVPPPPPASLGAPVVSLRATILRQKRAHPFDLALAVRVSLPLGTTTAFTRDPGFGAQLVPTLGLGRSVGPARVGLELGARVRERAALTPSQLQPLDEVGSEFLSGLVFSLDQLPVRPELAVRAAIPFTATPASVELLAAVRWAPLPQLELAAMGGPGLGKTPGTPAFRASLLIGWTPLLSAMTSTP